MIARMKPRGREAGFLLLETLIAVVLMSLLLTVLPGGIAVSKRMVAKSLSTVSAGLVAEAVLGSELAAEGLQAGIRSGNLDGYDWTAQIRPRAGLVPPPRQEEQEAQDGREGRAGRAGRDGRAGRSGRDGRENWLPYDVIVQVRAPDGTRVTVETLRIGMVRQ